MKIKVALGQFAVAREWQTNAQTCLSLMAQSIEAGTDLLVLPEGVLSRDITDPDVVRKTAQPVDGPFVTQLLHASQGHMMTVMFCLYIPAPHGRVWNVLVAIRNGEIIAQYRKLHLYDAFSMQESRNVLAGDEIPALVEVAGFKVGLMTCYDVRFPDLAHRLALDGAQVLVLPAGWVKGPLKERHWELLVAARALENTCYMLAVGECGERNIGHSMVVDPLGVVIAQAAASPALIFAELESACLNHARQQLPVLENRRFAMPQLGK